MANRRNLMPVEAVAETLATTIHLRLTAEALVSVMGNHVPVVTVDDGADFFACSCGWTETDEMVETDAAVLIVVADMAGRDAPDVEPGQVISVPSPNPLISHVIDQIIESGHPSTVASTYGTGMVQ